MTSSQELLGHGDAIEATDLRLVVALDSDEVPPQMANPVAAIGLEGETLFAAR